MKILVVGNSYCYYHNFGHLLRCFADDGTTKNSASTPPGGSGSSLRILQLSEGGKALADFGEDFAAVLDGGFDPDVILLQDFSMGPCYPGTRAESLEALRQFYIPAMRRWTGVAQQEDRRKTMNRKQLEQDVLAVKEKERNALRPPKRVFFYATHARAKYMIDEALSNAMSGSDRYNLLPKAPAVEDGESSAAAPSAPTCFTSERDLMLALEDGCVQYAECCRHFGINVAQVLPVGRVWYAFRQYCQSQGDAFAIDSLYMDDARAHPSPLGSFLSALTVWKGIFQAKRVNCRKTLPTISGWYDFGDQGGGKAASTIAKNRTGSLDANSPLGRAVFGSTSTRGAGSGGSTRKHAALLQQAVEMKQATSASVDVRPRLGRTAVSDNAAATYGHKGGGDGAVSTFGDDELYATVFERAGDPRIVGGIEIYGCMRDFVDRRVVLPERPGPDADAPADPILAFTLPC